MTHEESNEIVYRNVLATVRGYTWRGHAIPAHMHDPIARYVASGELEPDDFLEAILENNLREAFSRADDDNIGNVGAFLGFFHNYAPSVCWGSPARVKDWIEMHAAGQRPIEEPGPEYDSMGENSATPGEYCGARFER